MLNIAGIVPWKTLNEFDGEVIRKQMPVNAIELLMLTTAFVDQLSVIESLRTHIAELESQLAEATKARTADI